MNPKEQPAWPADPARSSERGLPQLRQIEGREWWLWGFAVGVTLLLTFAIISFTFPWFHVAVGADYWRDLQEWVRGLPPLCFCSIYTLSISTCSCTAFAGSWPSVTSFSAASARMRPT